MKVKRAEIVGLGQRVAYRAQIAVAFFCVSLLSTLPWLGTIGGWLDEGATMSAARRGISSLVELCRHHDAVLGTYYFAVHLWMSGMGVSLTSARSLSAICLAAATVVIADTAAAIGGTKMAILTGLQMVVVPGVSWVGLDARPTALATLIVSIALRILLASDSGTPKPLFYAIIAMASWVQFTTILQLACTLSMNNVRRARYWIATTLTGVIIAPIAWIGHQQSGQIGWIKNDPVGQLGSFFIGRFADAPKSTTVLVGAVSVSSVVVGAVYILACVLAVVKMRYSPRVRLLISWGFAPPAIAIAIGVLFGSPVYLPRYFSASLPAIFILVSLYVKMVWNRGVAINIAVIACSGTMLLACVPSAAASRVADGKWGENNYAVVSSARIETKPIVWLDDSLGAPLSYPGVHVDVPQTPDPETALRSDTLWGRRLTARDALAAVRNYRTAVVVLATRGRSRVVAELQRGGCRTKSLATYRRYSVVLATCLDVRRGK